MNLLEMLLGNSEKREGFEDFLNRFEEGPPSEGYSDREVLDRYFAQTKAAVNEALARFAASTEHDCLLAQAAPTMIDSFTEIYEVLDL